MLVMNGTISSLASFVTLEGYIDMNNFHENELLGTIPFLLSNINLQK